HGEQLIKERNDRVFDSLDDFKRRVPLIKEELRSLAELGALNCFAEHRRAALWRVEEPLCDDLLGSARASCVVSGDGAGNSTEGACAPLHPMTMPERVKADY